MTSSPLHKQKVDQGLEFNEEDKSWSANKVFKFERTNFREATWTEELSDITDILEFLPDRDTDSIWQWEKTPWNLWKRAPHSANKCHLHNNIQNRQTA